MIDEGTTYIRRVRSSCRGTDALALQLRVRALLDAVDLRPFGLSRHAIVLIRSLRAALPLKRDVPASVWQPALHAAVASIVRDAGRPAAGLVPADVAAVVFADRAELLACLARDWCAGSVAHRWWWRSLLNGGDVDRLLIRAWLEEPAYVPAALEQLAATRDLVRFVRGMPRAACATLVRSLLRTFGLRELATVLTPIVPDVPSEVGTTKSGAGSTDAATTAMPMIADEARRWLSDVVMIAVTPEQHALITIGLLLARAPAVLRTPQFARAFADPFVPVPEPVASHGDAPASSAPVRLRQTASRRPSRTDTRPPRQTFGVIGPTTAHVRPRRRARASDMLGPPDSRGVPQPVAPRPTSNTPLAPRLGAAAEHRDPQRAAAMPLDVADLCSVAPTIPVVAIDTMYGGVFYLVNLALFLNLYADFTQPLSPGLALPMWDWLALTSHALAGDALRADPIWPLLATLAHRDPQVVPGAGFEPPREWRAPPAWLAAFPEPVAWRWWTVGSRLRVAHPAGFPVLDVPRCGSPRTQLAEELSVYDRGLCSGLVRSPIRSRYLSPLHRWLGWHVAYIRARLVRALGLPDARRLPELLLRHAGRVVVSLGHLDIHLGLADLPIAVRLAGLDRDPGWVPAAGRAITFHFAV